MQSKIVLRESRKAFFFVYFMVTLMIFLVSLVLVKGFQIHRFGWIFIIGMAVIGLGMPEMLRNFNYCSVCDKLITIKSGGFFKRKQESFYLAKVTDISYHQNIWQKILNYGPIFVTHFGKEIRMGSVNRPKKRMEELTNLIDNHSRKKDI